MEHLRSEKESLQERPPSLHPELVSLGARRRGGRRIRCAKHAGERWVQQALSQAVKQEHTKVHIREENGRAERDREERPQ